MHARDTHGSRPARHTLRSRPHGDTPAGTRAAAVRVAFYATRVPHTCYTPEDATHENRVTYIRVTRVRVTRVVPTTFTSRSDAGPEHACYTRVADTRAEMTRMTNLTYACARRLTRTVRCERRVNVREPRTRVTRHGSSHSGLSGCRGRGTDPRASHAHAARTSRILNTEPGSGP